MKKNNRDYEFVAFAVVMIMIMTAFACLCMFSWNDCAWMAIAPFIGAASMLYTLCLELKRWELRDQCATLPPLDFPYLVY